MKTRVFATLCWLVNGLLIALDLTFLVDTLSRSQSGDAFFLAFCFLLAIIFSGFLVVLGFKSYKNGIYYLPEILFDEERRPAKLTFAIFGGVGAIALFGLIWFLLSFFGLNPYAPMERAPQELLIATCALLFANSALILFYGFLFRREPSDFRGM
jgi:small-conductance mechanosensitive channel